MNAAHARGEAAELGEAFQEMGYRLGSQSWIKPDVSLTHPDQVEQEYFENAPAIAIEIVSPSDGAVELRVKTEVWFRHGAREVWRVYRNTRQVVVDVPGGSRVYGEDDPVTTPLLPGFELKLGTILPPAEPGRD